MGFYCFLSAVIVTAILIKIACKLRIKDTNKIGKNISKERSMTAF